MKYIKAFYLFLKYFRYVRHIIFNKDTPVYNEIIMHSIRNREHLEDAIPPTVVMSNTQTNKLLNEIILLHATGRCVVVHPLKIIIMKSLTNNREVKKFFESTVTIMGFRLEIITDEEFKEYK